MTHWLNRCHFGDVRDVLQRMIAEGVKVQTIVTSPPYWGLRSYLPADHPDKVREIGSEPTLGEFLTTMVGVFDLCHQVLADDGTMWVNMGDSYAAASLSNHGRGKATPASNGRGEPQGAAGWENPPRKLPGLNLKPKDLIGQPWRLAFALQDAGWWLRQDIIWSKPNPMPESTRDRCTKAHEYVFLLSKAERYYYDFDAVQEPVNGGAHARRAGPNAMRGQGQNRPEGGGRANREGRDISKAGWKTPDGWNTGPGAHGSLHPAGREKGRKLAESGSGTKNNDSMDAALEEMRSMRNRRSVWTVASEPYKGAHFATFPTKLIEHCILAGAPAGGIVLDLFLGSGTTAQVAEKLGRQWIGIDIDERNKALQDERLRQPSLALEAA